MDYTCDAEKRFVGSMERQKSPKNTMKSRKTQRNQEKGIKNPRKTQEDSKNTKNFKKHKGRRRKAQMAAENTKNPRKAQRIWEKACNQMRNVV